MILANEFDELRRQLRSFIDPSRTISSIERLDLLSDCQILLDKLTQLEIYDLTKTKIDFDDLTKQIEQLKVRPFSIDVSSC